MSTPLETIARAFARPDVAPARAPSDLAVGEEGVVVLSIGETGEAKTFQGKATNSGTFYMDNKHNEVGNEAEKKMQDEKSPDDHNPARLMVITRVRNSENPMQYQDEVITVATLQKTGQGPDFQRWVFNLNSAKFGATEDTSPVFLAQNYSDVQVEVDAFKESHREDKINRMIIMRIRNPEDKTQYVDEAKTVGYRVRRTQGPDIEVELPNEKFQLVKPADRSDVFEVENEADLQTQGDIFRATHPS